ncbi:hypothetical protein RR11_134, partial [Ruegeria sp. R11]
MRPNKINKNKYINWETNQNGTSENNPEDPSYTVALAATAVMAQPTVKMASRDHIHPSLRLT